MRGTPRTLDEAIEYSLSGVAPLSRMKDTTYAILKDFLAQRFGAAMLLHPESEELLKKLFDDITRRDPK